MDKTNNTTYLQTSGKSTVLDMSSRVNLIIEPALSEKMEREELLIKFKEQSAHVKKLYENGKEYSFLVDDINDYEKKDLRLSFLEYLIIYLKKRLKISESILEAMTTFLELEKKRN